MMSVMILKVVDGRVSHTVWNLRKFALTIVSQKLREINAFLQNYTVTCFHFHFK